MRIPAFLTTKTNRILGDAGGTGLAETSPSTRPATIRRKLGARSTSDIVQPAGAMDSQAAPARFCSRVHPFCVCVPRAGASDAVGDASPGRIQLFPIAGRDRSGLRSTGRGSKAHRVGSGARSHRDVQTFAVTRRNQESLSLRTGTLAAFLVLPSWGALTSTTYGRVLLIKFSIVVLVSTLALAARRGLRRPISKHRWGWLAIRRIGACQPGCRSRIFGTTDSRVADPGNPWIVLPASDRWAGGLPRDSGRASVNRAHRQRRPNPASPARARINHRQRAVLPFKRPCPICRRGRVAADAEAVRRRLLRRTNCLAFRQKHHQPLSNDQNLWIGSR